MKIRTRAVTIILAIAFSMLLSLSERAGAQGEGAPRSGAPVISGKVFTFQKIADDIYYTSSSGPTDLGGHNTIIVGDRDVLLVDAGANPAYARALLEDMKLITDKPVRWVVNTHFHYDHSGGNSVYGPDVEIIGHEYIPHAISDRDAAYRDPLKRALSNGPGQIESAKKQIADEKDSGRRATLQTQLAARQSDFEQLKSLKLIPPNVTYSKKMTIFQGSREIQMLFLGKGHTQGDTVVFLPKERIVCTGDLMESRLAFMGDAMFDEWITTLDALKELDFDTALPGHGVPFHEKSLITAFQSYLKDFMIKVAELRKQGLTAAETAKNVDLTSHSTDFPQIQGPGAEIDGVRRMYAWMDERAKP